MVTSLRIHGGLIILGVLARLAFLFVLIGSTTPRRSFRRTGGPRPVWRIRRLRVGLHRLPHGARRAPFADGRAISSPMGVIWLTNITADKETGIGNWPLEDFRAAMVDGLAPEGTHL